MEIFLFNKPLALMALFAVILLFLHLIQGWLLTYLKQRTGTEEKESTFRGIYYVFYLFIAWACILFLLPLAIAFQSAVQGGDKKIFLYLLIFYPTIFLCLLLYGAKRGFLEWIKDMQWPNDEKEQP